MRKYTKTHIDELARNLECLLGYLKMDPTERKGRLLLGTSPYYRWLTYTLLRREAFEEIKTYSNHVNVA